MFHKNWYSFQDCFWPPGIYLLLPLGYYCRPQYPLCVLSHFSRVQLFATLLTVARQAPLSMGFSRQEYWSGFWSPPPGDLPHPQIKPVSPMSPALADMFFTWEAHWTPSKPDPLPFTKATWASCGRSCAQTIAAPQVSLHGQSAALWQHPGNQGKKPVWKAALLIFQVQITHLFLAKVHISLVSSIPLGRTKSKLTGSSPQVRQAVVGMNDRGGWEKNLLSLG